MCLLPEDSKKHAVEKVVADTVSGLMASVSSQPAREAMGKYSTRIRTVVESRVEDMLATVELGIQQTTTPPSLIAQMRAKFNIKK